MADVLKNTESEALSRPCVYFIERTIRSPGDAIKIGRSDGIDRRLRDHMKQPGVRLLAVMPAPRQTEKQLHAHFDTANIKYSEIGTQYGEETFWADWAEPNVREYVNWLLRAGYASDDVEDVYHLSQLPYQVYRPGMMGSRPQVAGQLFLLEDRAPVAPRAPRAAAAGFNHSLGDEWYTPQNIIEAARVVLGEIECDPASCPVANLTVKASVFYSVTCSGLDERHPWFSRVWLNPPYGDIGARFIERLIREIKAGIVKEAITCLNLAAMDTLWFAPIHALSPVHGIAKRRVQFINGAGHGEESNPNKGTVFSYFGDNPKQFARIFSDFTHIMWADRVTGLVDGRSA